MNNLPYYLALNRMNHVGPRTVKKLVQRWKNLKEMFELSLDALIAAGLPSKLGQAITQFNFQEIEADLQWAQQPNHHILTWESPGYPKLLTEITDPPVVLYAKGNLSAFEGLCVAMVGSRNPSITGAENAHYFAKELVRYGITIVSGLALGIDAQAHMGCIQGKGQTIAVMGTGMNFIYPKRHVKLAEEICQNGLILTEFPLNSPPNAGHFPQRNRIISGLSLCTLVIEAAIHSGSLITARMALEQNRDVLAIPGSIHNPLARGCHHLLQQGATLVTSVADILGELNLSTEPVIENKATRPHATDKNTLVPFIDFETTTIDQIVTRSGKTIENVTCHLIQLELNGIIQAVPGGYIRCIHER